MRFSRCKHSGPRFFYLARCLFNKTISVSYTHLGDMLEVGISKIKIGKKSFTIQFEIYHQGEDDLILLCESVYVGYDVENRTSRPITDLMRALLSS